MGCFEYYAIVVVTCVVICYFGPSSSTDIMTFCTPLGTSPSSSPISVTPCVARPTTRTSAMRVRTSVPVG